MSELTRGYISLVERGLKMPSIAALLRLATALDVNSHICSIQTLRLLHVTRFTGSRIKERRQ